MLKELEAARAELVSELQKIVLEVEAMKAEHQVAIDAVQKKHNDEMAAIRASLGAEGYSDSGELVCNFFRARYNCRNTLLYMRQYAYCLRRYFSLSLGCVSKQMKSHGIYASYKLDMYKTYTSFLCKHFCSKFSC